MALSGLLRKGKWFHRKYSRGKHIEVISGDFEKKRGLEKFRWKYDIASLFLPLQIYDEQFRTSAEEVEFEKALGKVLKNEAASEYIDRLVPYGGDIFSLFIDEKKFVFIVGDLTGHGFGCHTLAKNIFRAIEKHKEEPFIISSLEKLWRSEKNNIYDKAEKELKASIEKLRIKGIVPEVLLEKMKKWPEQLSGKFFSAGSSVVDFDKMKISMANFGALSHYLILMDEEGKILHSSYFGDEKRSSVLFGKSSDISPVTKENHVSLNKNIEKFRLVMYSDAVLEQNLKINDESQKARFIESLKRITDDKKLISEHLDWFTRKADKDGKKLSMIDYFQNEKLLEKVLVHTASKSPKEVVNFFYKYLIEENHHSQGDDITLVVADFEQRPFWQ